MASGPWLGQGSAHLKRDGPTANEMDLRVREHDRCRMSPFTRSDIVAIFLSWFDILEFPRHVGRIGGMYERWTPSEFAYGQTLEEAGGMHRQRAVL